MDAYRGSGLGIRGLGIEHCQKHEGPTDVCQKQVGNTLHSVHVPIRPDGSIEDGECMRQAEVIVRQAEIIASGT